VNILYYLIAFIIGSLTALAELLSRYKNFSQIWKIKASRIYLVINGVAAILAYLFIVEFDIAKNLGIFRVLLAGTSSLFILRSSFANIKVGDKTIEIGAGAILQVFLNTADRSFDQTRSNKELSVVKEVMKNVDFDKAKLALPTTCFNIMKNVSKEEQDRVSSDVKKLSDSDLDNHTKSVNLGILLSKITNLILLESAVESLSDSIVLEGGSLTPKEKLNQLINNKLSDGKPKEE
jgi:hypothetical protein